MIAPDSNRSGSARGITIHRSLNVAEVELRDGTAGYATDGTPVDCVRFAHLGLVGERPDLIVSGINYGYNLGDDVTYSGTVAAAFEGILLGIPGIAISQGAPTASGSDFRRHDLYDFAASGAFLARLVEQVVAHGIPDGTILNVNVPAEPYGAAVSRLGKRIYRDRLELEADEEGRRRYRIYGDDPSYHDEPGTDFRAIAEGRVVGHADPPRPDQLRRDRGDGGLGAQLTVSTLKPTSLGMPSRLSTTARWQLSSQSRRCCGGGAASRWLETISRASEPWVAISVVPGSSSWSAKNAVTRSSAWSNVSVPSGKVGSPSVCQPANSSASGPASQLLRRLAVERPGVDLGQPRVDLDAARRRLRGGDRLRRPQRALQRRGVDAVDGGRGQVGGRRLGLPDAGIAERHVRPRGEPVLGVPHGLAVPDHEQAVVHASASRLWRSSGAV